MVLTVFQGHHRQRVADLETGVAWTAEVRTPCTVYAMRDCYQPLRASIERPGESRLAWGPCGVRMRLLDEEGDPVRVDLIVDGERHVDDEGVVEVAGLMAGPHLLLVLPDDESYVGRELRVVLADNETRDIELTLASR